MHDDFAILLELPHRVAHVLDALLVGQHRALVDDLLDPYGRDLRVSWGQAHLLPFGPVAGESFTRSLVGGSRHGWPSRAGCCGFVDRLPTGSDAASAPSLRRPAPLTSRRSRRVS